MACLTQNLCLEHEKVWPASIMSMFLQQWFCSCRAWMICYKHLRIVSRLTTPKTLNCFILASTIGFGFHRTCKSRKNHFSKAPFLGFLHQHLKSCRAEVGPCDEWSVPQLRSRDPNRATNLEAFSPLKAEVSESFHQRPCAKSSTKKYEQMGDVDCLQSGSYVRSFEMWKWKYVQLIYAFFSNRSLICGI